MKCASAVRIIRTGDGIRVHNLGRRLIRSTVNIAVGRMMIHVVVLVLWFHRSFASSLTPCSSYRNFGVVHGSVLFGLVRSRVV